MRFRCRPAALILAFAASTVSAVPASASVVNDVLEGVNQTQPCVGFNSDRERVLNRNPVTGETYYPGVYVNSIGECLNG